MSAYINFLDFCQVNVEDEMFKKKKIKIIYSYNIRYYIISIE